MRRLFSFFVCLCLWAACSPRYYHGEQASKAFSQAQSFDSASFQKMIDRVVHDELQKQLSIHEWAEQTTVNEKLSQPDSTGAQHVTERTTTTLSKRSETSASTSHTKDEKHQEKVDSTRTKTNDSIEIKQEEKTVDAKVEGWMPWYVYAAGLLVAIIIGVVLALKGRKAFYLKKI